MSKLRPFLQQSSPCADFLYTLQRSVLPDIELITILLECLSCRQQMTLQKHISDVNVHGTQPKLLVRCTVCLSGISCCLQFCIFHKALCATPAVALQTLNCSIMYICMVQDLESYLVCLINLRTCPSVKTLLFEIFIVPYGQFCLLCFIICLLKANWKELQLPSLNYLKRTKGWRYSTGSLSSNKC